MQTYTGTVKEVGGPELGKSGHEKPRKIVISDSPDYQGKTFRIWSNDSDFTVLQENFGKTVTIEYEAVPVEMGDKKWTSNEIKSVQVNGNGEAPASDWSVPVSNQQVPVNPQPSPQPPPEVWHETKATISGKDDYWEQRSIMDQQRSLEMEAAWSVKAVLDVEGANAGNLTDDEIVDKALHIAILKRRIAAEMAE